MKSQFRYLLLAIGFTVLETGCSDSPVEPDGPAAKLVLVSDPHPTATVGTVVSAVVRLTDRKGRPISGESLTFRTGGEGWVRRVGLQNYTKSTEVITDADGKAAVEWTLGLHTVKNTLYVANTFSVKVDPVAISLESTPTAGPLHELKSYSGDGQRGERNSTLLQPLQVQALDAYGNGVRAARVQFSVIAGDGSLDGSTALTDSLGVATSGFWLLGDNVGPQKVAAASGDARVTFDAESLDCSMQPEEAACLVVGELAFVGVNDWQIYSVQSNGKNLKKLTSSGRNSHPVWSADGSRIAFINSFGPKSSIVLMNADGSDARVRTTSSDYRSVTWSPDGKFLAASTEGLYVSLIDIIPVDSLAGGVRNLTGMGRGPVWSPDGTQILYTRLSGDDGYDQLFVFNLVTGEDRPLTVMDPGTISSASWAPDGRRVAFVKCLVACDLYTIDAGGVNQIQLKDNGWVLGVAWSPDGKWIAISALESTESTYQSLFYVPAEGGARRFVARDASMPSWR